MIVLKRYIFRGVDSKTLQLELGPSLHISDPSFIISLDVNYDDSECDEMSVDQSMSQYGFYPDTDATKGADAFVAIVSPNGSIWKLVVDDAGVLTMENVKI